MTKPNYCPNCGKEMDDCVGIEDHIGRGGYDCYCKCEWSGNIFPDDENKNRKWLK